MDVRSRTPRLLSVAAGVDVVAANVLARALTGAGAHATIAPLSELLGETLERFARNPFDVVCVSAVPPSRLMHVRYICKRIAKQYPELDIVVVLWTLDLRSDELAGRMPRGERVHVVSSLARARARVIELAATLRVHNVRKASG